MTGDGERTLPGSFVRRSLQSIPSDGDRRTAVSGACRGRGAGFKQHAHTLRVRCKVRGWGAGSNMGGGHQGILGKKQAVPLVRRDAAAASINAKCLLK
eukprot:360078-Chlamydomonas_euryale.AAC.8